MLKQKAKFNNRYADNWKEISRRARQRTKGKCTLCDRLATCTHHAVYSDIFGQAIAGREVPGIEVFPLCKQCHKVAHHRDNWYWDKSNPALKNRNTDKFWLKLRRGWQNKC